MINHPYIKYLYLDETTMDVWTSKKGRKFPIDTGAPYRKLVVRDLPNGYQEIFYSRNERMLFHRFAWECYNQQKIPDGMIIRHYDDQKFNNSVENLRIGSFSDNYEDMRRNRGLDHFKNNDTRKAIESHTFYWSVTFPDGHEEVIYNMSQFCRDNNLSASLMNSVSKGHRNSHKGFTCKKIDADNS